MLCALAVTAGAQTPTSSTTPTIEQSLNLKSASNPRISPDGRFVAYQVQEADWDENVFKYEIWIASTDTGEGYQLTNKIGRAHV